MNQLMQGLRYTLRQLRRSPGFTATVVLTLALGIGANAAVFTLFDQVLLRMLPVERPRELVRLNWTGGFAGSVSAFGGDMHDYFSYPMYRDLRDRSGAFAGMIAAVKTSAGVSWQEQAENQDAEVVTGNYFELLGLRPAAGRLFTAADDTARGANPVMVLSYSEWKTRFAASPGIIGRTVLVNGHPFTVVGVAPANFDSAIGGYRPTVFLPVSMSEIVMPATAPFDNLHNRQSLWLTVVARLRPGATAGTAEAALEPLWHALRTGELELYRNPGQRFRTRFLDSRLRVLDDARGFAPDREQLGRPLAILMSMAGLLVLLCAINVATLLVLRASVRAREMAMRYALGAGRLRILCQLLLEGGLLGAAGAALGLLLAPTAAGVLVRLITSAEPGSEPYSAAVDLRVLLFTLAVSLAATLLFSAAPVLHLLGPERTRALGQNAGTASRSSQRLRRLAVGAQIALGVLLLGGAGLFLRTLDNLRAVDVGFDAARLLRLSLDPSISGYGEERTRVLVSDAVESLARAPGVVSAAATNDAELEENSETSSFSIAGYRPGEDESMGFEQPAVTPGYFRTLGQPVLAGREFTPADTLGRPAVAVVNRAFARRFFGSPAAAIGRLIGAGVGRTVPVTYDITIVGVVADIHHADLRTPLGPAVYLPWLQARHPGGVTVYVRSAQAPAMLLGAVRERLHRQDPTLVVDGLRPMEDQLERSVGDERALAVLAIGFASLAILLAAVGLYGVLSYSIEQRRREIGVRLALGCPRVGVIALVVREMAWIAGIGTVVALPATAALARLFASQLYGVRSWDPEALAGSVAVTVLVVALAAALPARRAAAVEPMRVLRSE